MRIIDIVKYKILSWLFIRIKLSLESIEAGILFNINVVENKIGIFFGVNNYTKNKSREKKYVISRQVLATVLRNNTNMTLDEIGIHICNQGHDNILHSIKTIDNLIENDSRFRAKFFRLMKDLNLKYRKYERSAYRRNVT
jgi:chromosomal replication initiation ATPase DnaA